VQSGPLDGSKKLSTVHEPGCNTDERRRTEQPAPGVHLCVPSAWIQGTPASPPAASPAGCLSSACGARPRHTAAPFVHVTCSSSLTTPLIDECVPMLQLDFLYGGVCHSLGLYGTLAEAQRVCDVLTSVLPARLPAWMSTCPAVCSCLHGLDMPRNSSAAAAR